MTFDRSATEKTMDVKPEVMDRASKYLAYRPRTRQELLRHLKERDVSDEEAAACADLLEEYHLLDDAQYSRMYIEAMTERGRGRQRICRELRQKGVDAFVIEDVFASMEDLPSEYDMARKQAAEAVRELDLRSMDHREKQKVRARIARRLAARGFSTETVYRAVRDSFGERFEESE